MLELKPLVAEVFVRVLRGFYRYVRQIDNVFCFRIYGTTVRQLARPFRLPRNIGIFKGESTARIGRVWVTNCTMSS